MTTSRHRRRKWALLLGTVAVFSLVGVYLLTSWTGSGLLSSPPPPQNYRLAFLGKYMWPVRRQLLRLRQTVFGPPQTVQVNGVIAELDPNAVFPPPHLIKGLTNDRGDRMWVADESVLREVVTNTAHATVLSQPGVTTFDGVQAQMAMTESSTYSAASNAPMLAVGYWLNVWPHTRSQRTDLTCFYTHSEMIRRPVTLADGTISREPVAVTNAAFGAEAHVPVGASVLLISGATNSRGRISAVLLTPSVVPKK